MSPNSAYNKARTQLLNKNRGLTKVIPSCVLLSFFLFFLFFFFYFIFLNKNNITLET